MHMLQKEHAAIYQRLSTLSFNISMETQTKRGTFIAEVALFTSILKNTLCKLRVDSIRCLTLLKTHLSFSIRVQGTNTRCHGNGAHRIGSAASPSLDITDITNSVGYGKLPLSARDILA